MITWKDKTEQYSNGYRGYLGTFTFFSVDWDRSNPPEGRPWQLSVCLPGIKITKSHYIDDDDAKAAAEQILVGWLKKAGLRQE